MKSTKEWISISDMMTGLMMVFLFISVMYMTQIQKQNEEIKDKNKQIKKFTKDYENKKELIYKKIKKEFQNDIQSWKAEIIKDSLVIRFSSPQIMFEAGSSIIKLKFKEILNNFCPRYFDLLYDLKKNIEEIRIEGHTSTEWEVNRNKKPWINPLTEKEKYFRNMKLSQDRSRSILKYCVTLKNQKKNINEWARSKLIANGLSSSRPICKDDTVRCRSLNRRVEFRIQVNDTEVLHKVIKTVEDMSLDSE